MRSRTYYVYMLTNRGGTLYTGVTGDLFGRVWQHRDGNGSRFTTRYNLNRLIWFEETDDITVAIAREKQIKAWRRKWKVDLVESEQRGLERPCCQMVRESGRFRSKFRMTISCARIVSTPPGKFNSTARDARSPCRIYAPTACLRAPRSRLRLPWLSSALRMRTKFGGTSRHSSSMMNSSACSSDSCLCASRCWA